MPAEVNLPRKGGKVDFSRRRARWWLFWRTTDIGLTTRPLSLREPLVLPLCSRLSLFRRWRPTGRFLSTGFSLTRPSLSVPFSSVVVVWAESLRTDCGSDRWVDKSGCKIVHFSYFWCLFDISLRLSPSGFVRVHREPMCIGRSAGVPGGADERVRVVKELEVEVSRFQELFRLFLAGAVKCDKVFCCRLAPFRLEDFSRRRPTCTISSLSLWTATFLRSLST